MATEAAFSTSPDTWDNTNKNHSRTSNALTKNLRVCPVSQKVEARTTHARVRSNLLVDPPSELEPQLPPQHHKDNLEETDLQSECRATCAGNKVPPSFASLAFSTAQRLNHTHDTRLF